MQSIGEGFIGRREVWLDKSSLKIRKHVINYRRAGDVGTMQWNQIVGLYFHARSSGEMILDMPFAQREPAELTIEKPWIGTGGFSPIESRGK